MSLGWGRKWQIHAKSNCKTKFVFGIRPPPISFQSHVALSPLLLGAQCLDAAMEQGELSSPKETHLPKKSLLLLSLSPIKT